VLGWHPAKERGVVQLVDAAADVLLLLRERCLQGCFADSPAQNDMCTSLSTHLMCPKRFVCKMCASVRAHLTNVGIVKGLSVQLCVYAGSCLQFVCP